MNTNVGKTDRAIRIVLGVALISVAVFSSFSVFESNIVKYGTAVAGLILAVTGLTRTCPAYALFGIKTCKSPVTH